MLNSFHSVVIETPDLEVGLREYAQLLGLPLPRIEVNAARKTRSGLFSLENMRLELRTSEAGGAPTGEARIAGVRLAGPDSAAIDEALRARALRPASAQTEVFAEVESEAERGVGREYRCLEMDRKRSRGLGIELISDEAPAFQPTEAGEASVFGLDHVVVYSTAPDATRRFYEEDLGIRLALDRTFEKRGVRLLFFRIGGATLEIGGKLDAPVKEDSVDRFGGLAWKVREIDAIAARLAAAGVDVSEVRDGFKAGTRVCTVRDQTQGVPTLLIEPVKS
ncbi:MAG: VOC family protein [Myxococcota bacterium]